MNNRERAQYACVRQKAAARVSYEGDFYEQRQEATNGRGDALQSEQIWARRVPNPASSAGRKRHLPSLSLQKNT